MPTNGSFETLLNPQSDIGYVSDFAAEMEESDNTMIQFEFSPSSLVIDFPVDGMTMGPGLAFTSDEGSVSLSPVQLAAVIDNSETENAGEKRNGKQKVSDDVGESESESEAEEVPAQYLVKTKPASKALNILTDANITIKQSGPTPSSSNLPSQNSVTFDLAQAQDNMKEPSGTVANRKTKRKGSVELSKAKKTKKGAGPFFAGESSKSSQQAEAEAGAAAESEAEGKEVSVEDLLKRKSVSEVLKVLTDRVNRLIKGDKETDMLDCLRLTLYMMKNYIYPCPTIALYLEQMIKEWPERADTIAIKETIKKMKVEEGENKKNRGEGKIAELEVPDEMNHRMRQVEEAIKKSAKERKQESRKTKNLDKILLTEMKDNMVDKSDYTCLLTYLMQRDAFGLHLPVLLSMNRIRQKLPTHSNLVDLKKKINGTEDEELWDTVSKWERRLIEAREETERESVKQQKISAEVGNLAEFFVSEEFSCETQREQLTATILSLGENGIIGQASVQDQGSLQTGIIKFMEDIKKEVFAEDNNKVDVSDFPGLKEAMTAERGIPDYLKPIASKIEEARGTPTEFVQQNIQLLVCAAIKEMQDQLQDLPLDQLNGPKLVKWGATLNLAKQLDFEVHFAEPLLQKNLCAHFGFTSQECWMTL